MGLFSHPVENLSQFHYLGNPPPRNHTIYTNGSLGNTDIHPLEFVGDEPELLENLPDLPLSELQYPSGRQPFYSEDSWAYPELLTFASPEGVNKIIPPPKAYWKFALDAVLAQVKSRLHRRSWAFMKKRRDVRREYIKICVRQMKWWDMRELIVSHPNIKWPPDLYPQPREEIDRLDVLDQELEMPDDSAFYRFLAKEVAEVGMRPVHSELKCLECQRYNPAGILWMCTQCGKQKLRFYGEYAFF